MKLIQFISRNSIYVEVDVDSKKNLFKHISNIFANDDLEKGTIIVEKLNEREKLGSTGVGNGVAIPHSKVDLIDKTRVIFLKLKSGIDFSASDSINVDIVFAILAPKNCQSEHLLILSSISNFLRNKDLVEKLRSIKSPKEIHNFFSKI